MAWKRKAERGRLSGHAQVRLRIPLLLLGALLLTALTISALTLYALKGQRAELSKTLRESQEQALLLLANSLEQSLLNAVQIPFLMLKNLPQEAETRMHLLRLTFPAVEQALFLNQEMALNQSFPPPRNQHQRRLNEWIVERLQEEKVDREDQPFSLHTLVETISGQPALFAFQPITEVPNEGPEGRDAPAPPDGWMLLRFSLGVLKASRIAPLLAEFSQAQGGSVHLQDPESEVGKDSLTVSLTRVLPGWVLVFDPPKPPQRQLAYQSWAIIVVAGGALLATAITSFAVWWEIRREYALVELRNRFVANVSHELKTPLSLIRMYAETLYLRRLSDPQKQREYHRVMLREAERLSQMINNVLDFAQLRAGVEIYYLTGVDLRATVSSVLERYRPQLEERGNVRLDISLQEQLPPVAHDPNGVTQILLNLLDNAIKYAASGEVVQVRLLGDEDWVELQVIDFGLGIAAEEHARLRQAFQRGRMAEAARGNGLGLTLVEQIARAHHAHFILDTPEGHSGVKAVVSFPSCKGEP